MGGGTSVDYDFKWIRPNMSLYHIDKNSPFLITLLNSGNLADDFNKYAEALKVGEDYLKMPEFIQIEFTNELPKNYPVLGKYEYIDEKTKIKRVDNLVTYEYNISKIKEESKKGNRTAPHQPGAIGHEQTVAFACQRMGYRRLGRKPWRKHWQSFAKRRPFPNTTKRPGHRLLQPGLDRNLQQRPSHPQRTRNYFSEWITFLAKPHPQDSIY